MKLKSDFPFRDVLEGALKGALIVGLVAAMGGIFGSAAAVAFMHEAKIVTLTFLPKDVCE